MKRKLVVPMLALSMVCSGITPFAGGVVNVLAADYETNSGVVDFGMGNASITIQGNEGQTLVGKEFNVYKLFNAENSVKGESINYTFNNAYKAALQNVVGSALAKTPSSVTEYEVIDYIQSLNNNKVEGAYSDQELEGRYSDFRYFIEDLRDEIVRLGCPSDTVGVSSVSSFNTIKISGLEYGYYIVDEVTDNDGSTDSASSLCMVDTANPNTSINIKSDYPTVTKKIKEDSTGDWSDIADFEIGQTVPYMYTSNIPNMNGYSTYYYAWHDVMDDALTFNSDSIEIVISDDTKEYTVASDEYSVIENQDGVTFKVVIDDIKEIVDREFNNIDDLGHNTYGQTVTLTYNATLNDNAADDTGRPGFENDVRLEFSNDPDSTGEGKTSFTPWDTVVCFTYKLDVLKTNDKDLALENAKFRLYSDENCENEIYVKEGENGYIVINEDSITGTTAPSDAVEMVSDSEGIFKIYGLDDGVYYLKETDAPDGYRQILDPIKLTIDATYTDDINNYIKGDGATDKTLEALDVTADIKLFLNGQYSESSNDLVTDVENGSANLTVINHVGSKLPVTGSFGTLAMIAIGAGAMAVSLKASKKEDKE